MQDGVREIARIKKDEQGGFIVVSRKETKLYSGEVSASHDIRLYFTPESTAIPTKKGVRFSTKLTLDVVKALALDLETEEREQLLNILTQSL